jgi:hypothetical protein
MLLTNVFVEATRPEGYNERLIIGHRFTLREPGGGCVNNASPTLDVVVPCFYLPVCYISTRHTYRILHLSRGFGTEDIDPDRAAIN